MTLTDLSPGEMFAVYDIPTGRIEGAYLYPALAIDMQAFIDAGKGVVQTAAVNTYNYYVTGDALQARPAMTPVWTAGKSVIVSDSVDTCTIDGIPQGSQVRTDGAVQTMDSGTSFTFNASTPGTVRVEIERWPYFNWIGSYTAVVPQA